MNFPTVSTSRATVVPPSIAGARRRLLEPIAGAPGEFLLVMDNSSLEKFQSCPKESEYYSLLGREPHAKSSALVFGGAIHHAIEALELGLSADEQDQRIVDFFANNPCIADYRSPNVALQVMKSYRIRRTFPDYEQEVLKDKEGKLLLEKAFELPLGVIAVDAAIDMPWLSVEEIQKQKIYWEQGTDIKDARIHVDEIHLAWSGRMDELVFTNNKNRVKDTKTTSIGGDLVTTEYEMAAATIGYVWASRQLYPEHDIRSLCMNFIHLKKPGPTGYPADLGARGPRGGEPPLNFFRSYHPMVNNGEFSDEVLAAWVEDMKVIASDFIANLVRNYFPRYRKQCVRKYGKCAYYDICHEQNHSVRRKLLDSEMFKDVTWNPVADR